MNALKKATKKILPIFVWNTPSMLKSMKYKLLDGPTKETFSLIFHWCDDLFPDISDIFFCKIQIPWYFPDFPALVETLLVDKICLCCGSCCLIYETRWRKVNFVSEQNRYYLCFYQCYILPVVITSVHFSFIKKI